MIPRHLFFRQFRKLCLQALQIVLGDLHGRNVRLREIPVVLCVLLGAHGKSGILVLIPPAGLLDDAFSLFHTLDLPPGLICDGPDNGLKGVEVLHLRAGAQLLRARGADGEVYIAAERALLHLAVGNPQILEGGAQLFQIGDDLLPRAEVGLGDDLNEGDAAAVVVCPRLVDPGVVDQLARVLLHVQLMDADGLARLDGHRAVPRNGQVELGDLICLRKVGIEIVFPVKFAVAGDLTVQGQPGLHRKLQHLFVHDGQRAGHACAHRAAVGVGRAAEFRCAGAEYFRPGGQLHMGLQADDRFPCHCASPPLGILV